MAREPAELKRGLEGVVGLGVTPFHPDVSINFDALRRNAAHLVEQEALAIFDPWAKRPGYATVIIKEAVNLCGMNAGPSRPPLAPLPEAHREELRGILARLGVLAG